MTKLAQFRIGTKIQRTDEADEVYERVERDLEFFFELMEMLDFEAITQGRYSTTFLIGLLNIHMQEQSIEPIIDEIKALENLEGFESRTKPATQFQRSPLKGLWHKHFFIGNIGSIAQNLINSYSSQGGLKKIIEDVCVGSGESVITKNTVNQLLKVLVGDSFEKRSDEKKLTGEWIIYHEVDNKKYYLTVAGHNFNDDDIANNIKDLALFEYPIFKDTLEIFSD